MTPHEVARHAAVPRRLLLQALASCAVWGPAAARAQSRVPIADLHSHYGLLTRPFATSGLADEMRQQRVALMAWKHIADLGYTRLASTGIVQSGEPLPGAMAARFDAKFKQMRAYITQHGLRAVLTGADVDACIAADGPPGIVLASEGADFLEGDPSRLPAAHAKGLRHLQLVHYIRTRVGDSQTGPPVHNGLSALGRELVVACNALGILVDLAHCSEQAVVQALQLAKQPPIWSHGWVDQSAGRPADAHGYLQRRLSLATAKQIAERGGVVGLWALGLHKPGGAWRVAVHDTRAYATEIARLVDQLGGEHVALGSDIEGLGANWVVNDYAGVRTVIDHLQQMKLPSATIERVACGNYARVLKAVLSA